MPTSPMLFRTPKPIRSLLCLDAEFTENRGTPFLSVRQFQFDWFEVTFRHDATAQFTSLKRDKLKIASIQWMK